MDWIRIAIGVASLPFSFLGFAWSFIAESFRAGRQWYFELSLMLAACDRTAYALDPLDQSGQVPVAPNEGEAPEPPGRSVSPSENYDGTFGTFTNGC